MPVRKKKIILIATERGGFVLGFNAQIEFTVAFNDFPFDDLPASDFLKPVTDIREDRQSNKRLDEFGNIFAVFDFNAGNFELNFRRELFCALRLRPAEPG